MLKTILQQYAESWSEKIAIQTTENKKLSYLSLYHEIEYFGIDDEKIARVAIVMADNFLLSKNIIVAMCHFVVAPLNPRLTQVEFTHYFQILQIDALIVHKDDLSSVAIIAAKSLKIPVIPVEDLSIQQSKSRDKHRTSGLLLTTSGTTSTPKIIFFAIDKIIISAQIIASSLALTLEDQCFNLMPLFHIHGLMTGLLAPLVSGGNVLLSSQLNTANFLTCFDQHEPTWVTGTPSIYKSIINRAKYSHYFSHNKKLRFIRSSSESLSKELHSDLERIFSVPIIQVYGITESSHPISAQKIDGSSSLGSVGFPINIDVKIDKNEIIIKGSSVISAYENNEEANKLCFYEGWFRTGDLGYMTAEGELFITGRIKEMINKSGEKISPYEMEKIIEQLPSVNEVACFPIKDEHVGEKIGVAIVLNPEFKTNASAIKNYVSLFLAHYKMPDMIYFVDAIPKSEQGKLQRNQLEKMLENERNFLAKSGIKKTITPFETKAITEKLIPIIEEVFNLSPIQLSTSFFELGGDSILGMQLVSRINELFDINLDVRDLYNTSNWDQLVPIIHQAQISNKPVDLPIIPKLKPMIDKPQWVSLSSNQKQVWFVSQLPKTDSLDHIFCVYHLQGHLSLSALEWSIEQIVARHESLRIIIKMMNGRLYQSFHQNKVPLKISQLASEEEIHTKIHQLMTMPFNLNGGSLFQPYFFQITPQNNILCFHFHHIIGDLWSKQILQKELSFYYNKKETLPETSVTYTDYAHWLHTWQTEAWFAQEIAFWKTYLNEAPALLPLPTDYPRPQEMNYTCEKVSFELPEALVLQLKQFAAKQNMTLYVVLLTVFKVLLQHYTEERKIVVGVPIANRTIPALENIFGFFANTGVIATSLPERTLWKEAFSLVKTSVLEALAHSFCPFDVLVKSINPERHLNYHPIFQVMFNFVNVPNNQLHFSNLIIDEIPIKHVMSSFDIHFSLISHAHGISCTWYYNKSLFKSETIERWARHYQKLLILSMDWVLHSPSTLISSTDFLLDEEKDLLLNQWNATNQYYPYHETTIGKFEAVVKENSHNIALICGSQKVTYAELNAKANHVAKNLISHGVKPDDLIAIMIERSIDMVAGLLGIWKAGAGYVPFNREDPNNRLEYVLQETQCQFILTKLPYAKKIACLNFLGKVIFMDADIDVEKSSSSILPKIHPENIAYVLYTSGSTGKPKGVVVEHRSLWEYLWAVQDWAKLKAQNRFLQLAPYTFDASLFDMYLPLISNVTVVLPETDNNYDLSYLTHLIVEKKINYLKSVPSFLRLLSEELKTKDNHSLQNIYSVGEELLLADVQRLQTNTGANIYNQYGPTETIGIVSADYCERDAKMVTLGRPIANVRLYVLNPQLQPVALGCYGELYITKHYLATGYLGHKELTAHCFIPNPFLTPAEKIAGHYLYLYQSGDKVRWLPDGRLQFAGRIDLQIKMNGKRVEIGEIEAVIATHRAVQAVAVIKMEQQLIAFIVLNQVVELVAIRSYVAEYLPAYMLPAHWIILEALPVTQSGKVDRKQLPSLWIKKNHQNHQIEDDIVNTQETFAEKAYLASKMTDVLRKLLSYENNLSPDIHKNFFELGIDSLRLIEFCQILKNQFSIPLTIHHLFQYQNISTLSQYIFKLLQKNTASLFDLAPQKFVISLQKEGLLSPLFIIPGGIGEENEMLPFMLMLKHAQLDRPLYGIRSRVTDLEWKKPKKLNEQAQAVFEEIKKIQPQGPYYFLGECIANAMVLELVKIAEQQGEPAGTLILLDSRPFSRETFPFSRYFNQFSLRRKEQKARKKRYKTSNIPHYFIEYYHLLALGKPIRLKSQLHLILSSSMQEPDEILERWKPFFHKTPYLYLVSGDHTTYIRQDSAETMNIICTIMRAII